MKKIVIVLIFIIVVPVFAIASSDPVTGVWYLLTDVSETSDYEMMIWILKDGGTAHAAYVEFKKTEPFQLYDFNDGSTWRRDGYDYFLKDGETQEQKMYLEGDSLWIYFNNSYVRLRRFFLFDMDTDFQLRK